MPDIDTTLGVLLADADDREKLVIRRVAFRAGMLRHCRCGRYNPADADRCENCRTQVLPDIVPTTVAAHGLIAVRAYLVEAHGDAEGDSRFVAACRSGNCGGLALEVADDTLVGAERYSYGTAWAAIAEEIIAGVEARAAVDGAPKITPATTD